MTFIKMTKMQFNHGVVFIVIAGILLSMSSYYSQMIIPPSILASSNQSINSTSSPSATNNNNSSGPVSLNIPTAKSVFETGTLSLPSSVKGFIISLPDETHELDTANKTISHKNAHYLPTNLIIPSGASIAFVHGIIFT
jgi:hypothetical protein